MAARRIPPLESTTPHGYYRLVTHGIVVVYGCTACGALVTDWEQHDIWHGLTDALLAEATRKGAT